MIQLLANRAELFAVVLLEWGVAKPMLTEELRHLAGKAFAEHGLQFKIGVLGLLFQQSSVGITVAE